MANHCNYNNKRGLYFCGVLKRRVHVHRDCPSRAGSLQANQLPGEAGTASSSQLVSVR